MIFVNPSSTPRLVAPSVGQLDGRNRWFIRRESRRCNERAVQRITWKGAESWRSVCQSHLDELSRSHKMVELRPLEDEPRSQ
jgi:hypothetical protein